MADITNAVERNTESEGIPVCAEWKSSLRAYWTAHCQNDESHNTFSLDIEPTSNSSLKTSKGGVKQHDFSVSPSSPWALRESWCSSKRLNKVDHINYNIHQYKSCSNQTSLEYRHGICVRKWRQQNKDLIEVVRGVKLPAAPVGVLSYKNRERELTALKARKYRKSRVSYRSTKWRTSRVWNKAIGIQDTDEPVRDRGGLQQAICQIYWQLSEFERA